MAGFAAAGCLTRQLSRGDLTFAVATVDDEPDIRRLLRENPLGGDVMITLEREPDVFRADCGLARAQAFIVARDARTDRVVGVCERAVRESFVDGRVTRLPYLSALRVAAGRRGQIRMLRGGFDALRRFAEQPGDLPFAMTAVTSDNVAAQRVLTAGVAGLPRYVPVEELSTFALRPRRSRLPAEIRVASKADLPAVADFLQRANRGLQFAQVWTETALLGLADYGLAPEHMLLFERRGRIRGCIAVWDQRGVRQVVIHRYPAWLGRLRPAINALSPLTGLPPFPPTGAAINQVMLSHLAVEDDDPPVFATLLSAALSQASVRKFDVAMLGLASSRGLSGVLIRHHRVQQYRTMLYLVCWPEHHARVALQARTGTHAEIALM